MNFSVKTFFAVVFSFAALAAAPAQAAEAPVLEQAAAVMQKHDYKPQKANFSLFVQAYGQAAAEELLAFDPKLGVESVDETLRMEELVYKFSVLDASGAPVVFKKGCQRYQDDATMLAELEALDAITAAVKDLPYGDRASWSADPCTGVVTMGIFKEYLKN